MLGLLPLLTRTKYGWVIALVLVGLSLAGGLGGLGGVFGGGTTDHAADVPQQGAKTPDAKSRFVGFVLDDVQKTWKTNLPDYRNAKLVLFTDATDTACGYGRAATGPFYCPADERVYIDLSFYEELERRLGAKGDFAQAYVIAHEIGHHVQNQLGTSDRVHAARQSDQVGAEGLSVRLELQADCFAGVWAHASKQRDLLDVGDIEEAMNAAAAIGDDRLQRSSTGRVHPERWTHGSSAQRARWFERGLASGSPDACDTFRAGKI
jgi:predicted metalloprotease